LAEDQFVFRRSKGTREVILALRIILEKRINRNKKTYMAFVDLEKAFDNVDWNRIFEILKKIGVKYKDKKIIHSLYKIHMAVVKCGGTEKEAGIKKGVRQSYSLLPLIFNTYTEEDLNEVREKMDVGMYIQSEKIDMLHFADDIVVLAENKDELERFLYVTDTVLKENYSMNVNRSETKVMVCGKYMTETLQIRLRNEELQEMDEFCYLVAKSLRMVGVQRK
jgi:hypothetical protein